MAHTLDKIRGKHVDKTHVRAHDGIYVRVRVVWIVRAYYIVYLQNQKHQNYDSLNTFIAKIIIIQLYSL